MVIAPATISWPRAAASDVEKFYAGKTASGQFKGCDAYSDFREILARKDIDAVVIIAPDHWHAIMTVLAARAGKDIYCEKPLSLTIEDGKEMVRAVRKYGRILQTGSQWRSTRTFARPANSSATVASASSNVSRPMSPPITSPGPARLEGNARARGFRLRFLAGASPESALPRRPVLLSVSFHPGLFRGPDHEFRSALQ